MSDLLKTFFAEFWPEILACVSGFVVSFFLYLKTRLTYKTKLTEKEIKNVELQKVIAEGSYIICPSCGNKVFLQDLKIYTGGKKDEIETKSE